MPGHESGFLVRLLDGRIDLIDLFHPAVAQLGFLLLAIHKSAHAMEHAGERRLLFDGENLLALGVSPPRFDLGGADVRKADDLHRRRILLRIAKDELCLHFRPFLPKGDVQFLTLHPDHAFRSVQAADWRRPVAAFVERGVVGRKPQRRGEQSECSGEDAGVHGVS